MVAVILLGVLGTRLWFLQGTQQQAYQNRVTTSKIRTVYIPPERGRIFDATGRILADNKQTLTITADWSVLRDKKDREELFTRLSGPLQMPVAELQRRYNPCFGEPSIPKCKKGQIYSSLLPLPLKEDVDENTVNKILERAEDFPGVAVREDYKRVYPYAPLASHVVGYLGSITAESLANYREKGYNANERVGQFGVELSMESELHGSWGKRVFEIDAAGSIVREEVDQAVAPVAGKDVQLTIDLQVQQYAEQALQSSLQKQRNLPDGPREQDGGAPGGGKRAHNPPDRLTQFRTLVYSSSKQWGTTEWVPFTAPAGSVVVENYQNGQILAMASYPTFDNRWQISGISGDKYKALFPETDDPDKSILVNRALQGQYNMGSSIKPFVAWSAMTAHIIEPNTYFLDEGQWTLESIQPPSRCQEKGGPVRCTFTNAVNPYGVPSQYGPVSVEDALAVSSDAFFYRIGEKFFESDTTADQSYMKSFLAHFGFGNRTGIQLPFEFTGRVPDTPIKKDLIDTGRFGKNEEPELVVGDDVQVAIGQGLLAASPLQAVNAYSTLANGGHRYQPSIIKNILAPLTANASEPEIADLAKSTIVTSFDTPTVVEELEMPDEIRQPIVNGLERVIYGPGTTYKKNYNTTTGEDLFAGYNGMPLAGKTGTAQGSNNYPWNDSSAFGAFSTDAERPYAVYAYLEKAGYGSRAAGPVVRCVFAALSDPTRMDAVAISDPLDLSSTQPAPPTALKDTSCLVPGSSTD